MYLKHYLSQEASLAKDHPPPSNPEHQKDAEAAQKTPRSEILDVLASAYADDVLIFSGSEEEALGTLRRSYPSPPQSQVVNGQPPRRHQEEPLQREKDGWIAWA